MILTGRRVSAAEGKELGFVNEVIPAAQLMTRAKDLAKQIMELSPMSVRASKQAVYRGLDEASIADALKNQNSYPAIAAMFKSDDLREGPRAFAEKRAPQWKGPIKQNPRAVSGAGHAHAFASGRDQMNSH